MAAISIRLGLVLGGAFSIILVPISQPATVIRLGGFCMAGRSKSKGRRKVGRKKRRMRAKIRHRKG
jgi:hypothetical protein